MAERSCHTGSTRRQSFRKTLAEAGLPQEYLDALEQKRKQLDESIHKYIAAKEREYKQYEKELRQQYKLSQDKEVIKPRRTSSESTQDTTGSPRLYGQQQSVVDVLLAAGLKRDQIGQSVAVAIVDDDGTPTLEAKSSMAGMTDRRASIERDKEFVGVFTPAFLPALENKAQSNNDAEQGSSAPPPSSSGIEQGSDPDGVQRAHSDSLIQAKGKRPAQLQLIQRTSSSGSSADGKLTSALKSPTQSSRQSKRKRVSIAVGNSIVAPSDNVPAEFSSNNHTPSHSRTRSPASERDSGPTSAARAVESLKDAQRQAESNVTRPESYLPLTNGKPSVWKEQPSKPASTTPAAPKSQPPTPKPSKIDPDGDLFDLDDDDDDDIPPKPEPIPDDSHSSEDDITGRVNRNPRYLDDGDIYDPDSGIIPENEGTDDHADHIEFMPGSANASQQPTNPGFRRPSVSMDPVYMGNNYARAEHSAVVNEVYGSSYNRPASKGSFTAGSLGESFMARNAEMLRNRASHDESQVRS